MARKFGIEIEVQMPAGVTHRSIANALTAAGVVASDMSYNHNTTSFWKVVQDGSLGYRGAEIVSPPMPYTAEGLADVARVMNALTEIGCTVDRTCGLHIHIDASGLGLRGIANVAKCFVKFENFFDHIMPASRRASQNQYVQSNRNFHGGYADVFANRAIEALGKAKTTTDLIRANQGGSRYFKLNLQPLNRYGTIEFRQHSGTADAAKAVNWIKLLMAFVEKAAVSKPRARKQADITPVEDMARFFKMFEVEQEVRAFYIARRKQLHGDAVAA